MSKFLQNSKKVDSKNSIFFLISSLLLLSLINIDLTSVNIGVPKIVKYFHITSNQGQLILSIENLTFAVFMVLFSRLAELFGERRLFNIGIIVFLTASILCGLAHNYLLFIVGRFLQGASFAIIFPILISILVKSVEFKRILLFGVISLVAGASQAIGPLIGGFIMHVLSWRYLFYINIPILLFIIVLISVETTEYSSPRKNSLEWGKLSIIIYMLFALNFYFIAFTRGFNIYSISSAVFLLLLLIVVEVKRHYTIFKFNLFFNKNFTFGCLIRFVIGYIWFGLPYISSLYLQDVANLSAKHCGYLLSIIGVAYCLFATVIGLFASKRTRPLIVFALLQCIFVYLWFCFFVDEFSILSFLWLFLATGILLGIAIPCLSDFIFSSIPNKNTSSASGIYYTLGTFAATLGVKASSTIYTNKIGNMCGFCSGKVLSLQDVFFNNFKLNIMCMIIMMLISVILAFSLKKTHIQKSRATAS